MPFASVRPSTPEKRELARARIGLAADRTIALAFGSAHEGKDVRTLALAFVGD